jgi:beta-glucanase (GH16 family)
MNKAIFKYPTATAGSSNGIDSCSSLFVEARIMIPLVKGYKVGFGLFPEPQTQPPTAKICTVEEECGAYGIWPASGEMNVVDHTNDAPSVGHAVQFKASGVHAWLAASTRLNETAGDWHNYTLEWHCDYIRWYLDGVKVHAVARGDMETWPFDQPFYLVMGVSVGGNLVGPYVDMSKPGAMFVDYIKVYDKASAPAVRLAAESPAPAPMKVGTSDNGTSGGTVPTPVESAGDATTGYGTSAGSGNETVLG